MNEFATQYEAVVRYGADNESLDAFHRRIDESPEQPLPRLVLADYLDDNGMSGVSDAIRLATEQPNGFSRRVSRQVEGYQGKPFTVSIPRQHEDGTVNLQIEHQRNTKRPTRIASRRQRVSDVYSPPTTVPGVEWVIHRHVARLPKAEAVALLEMMPSDLSGIDGAKWSLSNPMPTLQQIRDAVTATGSTFFTVDAHRIGRRIEPQIYHGRGGIYLVSSHDGIPREWRVYQYDPESSRVNADLATGEEINPTLGLTNRDQALELASHLARHGTLPN